MVKKMEHPRKMDDLGGKPTIFGNIHILASHFFGGSVLHTIFRTFLQNHYAHQFDSLHLCRCCESRDLDKASEPNTAGSRFRFPRQDARKPGQKATLCYPTESGPANCLKDKRNRKSEIGTTGISHQEIQLVMHWTQGAQHADLIQM